MSSRKYERKTRRPERLTAKLSRHYGVSESTIKRDGQYAHAVDQLAKLFDITPDQVVGTADKKDVIELARLIG